jgi:predicted secreted protein with PEFG-CTERM motif
MKSKPFGALFGLLALVAILGVAPAFGETDEVTIATGAGSSASAACVTTNNCFSPNPINVAPGTEVDWKNTDSVSHTVTSGKVSDDNAGSMFDSGLIKKGNDFKFTFATAGTYNYFCTVHPWMVGQVVVGGAATSSTTTSSTATGGMSGMAMLTAKASDGTTITISTSGTTSGQPLTLAISFTDANGNKIHHQNYAINVTQNGNNVLSNSAGHTHTGDDTQTSANLSSSDPVDVQITLNGIGLPTADPSTWTGVKGETLSFTHIVPEFGPVASIVLAIAVLSIVVFAAKTRVIPRL